MLNSFRFARFGQINPGGAGFALSRSCIIGEGEGAGNRTEENGADVHFFQASQAATGFILQPEGGAVLMTLSTVVVAINARLLKVPKQAG